MAHSYVTSFTCLEEVWPQTLVAANGDSDPVDFIALTKGWLIRACELLRVESRRIHEGELAAFLSYAIAYPQNFLSVIDSYSVGCGLLNFCAVALALCELGYRPVGVRLDSGDLCSLSVDVRQVFRRCSEHFSVPAFDSLIIVGTNNISEKSLTELSLKENQIDVVGVGTHLVTCTTQPSLGCVYKLVEVRGRPRMKISEDPEKSTVPGRKQVYRLMDTDAPPEPGVPLSCFPLCSDRSSVSVTPAQVHRLRQEVFVDGQVTARLCSATETRTEVQTALKTLHPRHQRLQEPDSYTVIHILKKTTLDRAFPLSSLSFPSELRRWAGGLNRPPTVSQRRCNVARVREECVTPEQNGSVDGGAHASRRGRSPRPTEPRDRSCFVPPEGLEGGRINAGSPSPDLTVCIPLVSCQTHLETSADRSSSGPCRRPRTQVACKGDLVRSSCTGTRSPLEMGTVMTVFYQKKSQRPERRTFQIKPDTRLLVWSRNPDKSEGESEYEQAGRAGTGPTPPRTSCSWCSSTDRPVLAQLHTTSDKPSWFLVVDHTAGEAASGSSGSSG
ncbi:nicotinate phosphoribosyltransferase [Takifugu rubripes]|uniref:nicotinate phosphoribosyltransferase n=1 Tax=Takifugu rubripes TaxID=31033 RepID=Q6XQM8_TAKRU|nr:nicotinate phosphoribosyltransferase [Takifugu rubripes]AAP69611.1 nicotinate phosphoribosyltransferase-like protein [Takifugu rubripes]|eukprot:NP_001027872.1 nicotinate phosphoribosyltransferase [Takifugu rubripes]